MKKKFHSAQKESQSILEQDNFYRANTKSLFKLGRYHRQIAYSANQRRIQSTNSFKEGWLSVKFGDLNPLLLAGEWTHYCIPKLWCFAWRCRSLNQLIYHDRTFWSPQEWWIHHGCYRNHQRTLWLLTHEAWQIYLWMLWCSHMRFRCSLNLRLNILRRILQTIYQLLGWMNHLKIKYLKIRLRKSGFKLSC